MHVDLPSYGPRAALTGADRIDAYLRVINALMLRDMRTRFFGSWWGYFVQVMWPVVHMLVLTVAMLFRGQSPPFGDSAMVFAATGAVPALAFSYISNEIMKGIQNNKPLTYYPQVRILDVALSRIMVEVVNSFMGVAVIFAILFAAGQNPVPADVATAAAGYVAALALGVAMGMINMAIVIMFPGWQLGYILVRIGMYFASGVMFLPSLLPEQIYSIMRWNPLLQVVEWVRLGYEPRLPVEVDYYYVVLWILCLAGVGLAMERTISRRYAA